jgi:hypothetical protein
MSKRILTGLAAGIIALLLPSASGATPSQLYGKSIVISTSQTRTFRPVGGGETRTRNSSQEWIVYVSSAGRTFVRSNRAVSVPNHRHSDSKTIDTAPGEGPIGVSTSSSVRFSGSTMIMQMQYGSGGTQITVTFDGGFTGCTASVANGREGNKHMVIRSRFDGSNNEILDMSTSVNGCSVRAGNGFGG